MKEFTGTKIEDRKLLRSRITKISQVCSKNRVLREWVSNGSNFSTSQRKHMGGYQSGHNRNLAIDSDHLWIGRIDAKIKNSDRGGKINVGRETEWSNSLNQSFYF